MYSYARTQETIGKYKKIYERSIEVYEKCSKDRTGDYLRREFGVISRTTYFRRQNSDLVLKIRLENPTRGGAKIAVILKLDYGSKLSESTVRCILKRLMEKRFMTKSVSAIKTKRK
jgi:hypothetical protein